jgi:hypothetical protein
MKLFIFSILALILFSTSANAATQFKELAGKDVSNFELLVNNLNMIYLVQKISNSGQPKANAEGIIETYFRFSMAAKDRMRITVLYLAPVAQLTESKCKEILRENQRKIKVDNKSIVDLITSVSLYPANSNEASLILEQTEIVVLLTAKENAQLGINCAV